MVDPWGYKTYLHRGMLFRSRGGVHWRIFSFMIDHPHQGPVVVLPIIAVGNG